MAKNFPYFKFIATEWLTGNIVYESLSAQGLFINICATYWQRNGKLSLEEVNRRYKNPVELSELTDRFFSVNEGFIIIKFLDEQLIEAGHISKTNSKNGKKGGRPKGSKTLDKKPIALISENESEAKKSKEEKEEEKKKNKKENNIEDRKLKFASTLNPFFEKYPKELISKFIAYWCESNKSNTKFRYELEKTWDLERRLQTWASRDSNFNQPKSNFEKLEITEYKPKLRSQL